MVACCSLCAVSCVLFVGCWSLFVGCCLLLIVGCLFFAVCFLVMC